MSGCRPKRLHSIPSTPTEVTNWWPFLFMFYVYILQSEITKQFYKGQTDDLQRRLKEHNNGEEKSTAPFCPWVLVWHTSVETRSKAVILEKKLKNIIFQFSCLVTVFLHCVLSLRSRYRYRNYEI